MIAVFKKPAAAHKARFAKKIQTASVDKQRDIHSVKCAKFVSLQAHLFLSHNHPVWIPPFYSDFQIL